MNVITDAKQMYDREITRRATDAIIRKLSRQGIDHARLDPEALDELIRDEIAILRRDTQKTAVGIGIGLLIGLLAGV